MATNATHHVTNSTHVCSLSGIFSWQQQYLTTNLIILLIQFAASVEALTCPFTILMNALVILAVKRKRCLRKMKSSVLLVCLAGTDLLVGAIIQPLVVANHLLRIYGVGPICLMDKIIMRIGYMAYMASLFHLVIISCECYIAIKHALRYETLVTSRRLTISVALSWAIAVVIPLEDVLLVGIIPLADVWQLQGIPTFFLVSCSLLLVSFCQGAVLLECRRHRKHIKANQVSESSAKKLLKRDKAAVTTTIVVAALFLCFTPQVVFFGVALNVKNIPGSILFSLATVIDAVLYFNSLINPMIYCIRLHEFRRVFKEFLGIKDSQIHVGVGMNENSTSRGQRNLDNKVGVSDSSHETEHMGWPDPMNQRASRSHSFDVSNGRPSHKGRTRRTNSV